MLVTSFLLVSTAQAATPTCTDVISKCDKALAEKDKALQLSDIALKQCSRQYGEALDKVDKYEQEANVWYHNPVVMFVFGAAAGTVTYAILHK